MEGMELNQSRRNHEQGSFAFGGERNEIMYKHYLGIDLDSLKGKTVLNIGGGPTGKFEKEARKKGVNMISISPDYKWGVSDTMKKQGFLENQTTQVAARVQELPFPDETFDCELALYSVPMYLPPIEEEYIKYLKEITRTLKHGGTAYIYPGHFNSELKPEAVRRILKSLSPEVTYSGTGLVAINRK